MEDNGVDGDSTPNTETCTRSRPNQDCLHDPRGGCTELFGNRQNAGDSVRRSTKISVTILRIAANIEVALFRLFPREFDPVSSDQHGQINLGEAMTRIIQLPALLLATLLFCPGFQPAVADESGQSGVLVQWQSQVMIDGSRDQVAEIHLHVHDDRADSYYELRYPGFRQTISFDDLNPRGIPFRDVDPKDPSAGARQWAELRKEILEAEGKTDIAIELITVPRTTLYALTGSGGLHAFDAETGATRWKTRIGTQFEPTIGMAANNTRIIAVRGSKVYCLDALTGDEIWSRFAHYAPGGGVAVSDHYAYVTSIEGRLQMFPLNETGLPEAFFASSGAATFDPEVTPRTVSWATERGYFNVARSNVVSLRYRLATNDKFESPGAAVGDMLIANSVNGKVYALAEEMGSLAWEFAVGERLEKKPIGIGRDVVMLITTNNNLIALNAQKGTVLEGWPKRVSGISEYVGASQEVLYFVGTNGRLLGLNRKSGAVISSGSLGSGMMPVANHVTDRLYVAHPSGLIRCLREVANVNPVIHGEDFVVGNTAGEGQMKKPGQPEDAGANPFESGSGTKTDPDDPFSGGDPDDPFSGGDSGSDPDDPFSGGDNGSDDDPFDG